MYGWRGRVGVVLPCINTAMEPELNRLALGMPGLAIHCARVHLEETKGKGLAVGALMEMERESVDIAAPELAHARVGVIVYGCTSGSFAGGSGWDKEIIRCIQDRTGLPATTAMTAMVAALNHFGAKRIAFGTPYDAALTELGRRFLEQESFDVVNTVALDNIHEINTVPFSLAYNLGVLVDTPEADSICIGCTDFPTIDILDTLEADRGKPAVSANAASLWHALCLLGMRASISGYGRLLRG